MCQIETELVEPRPCPRNTPHRNRRNMELSCDKSQESSVLLAPINVLEKSRLRERKDGFGHDQVIQDPDVDERQSFPESSCD